MRCDSVRPIARTFSQLAMIGVTVTLHTSHTPHLTPAAVELSFKDRLLHNLRRMGFDRCIANVMLSHKTSIKIWQRLSRCNSSNIPLA